MPNPTVDSILRKVMIDGVDVCPSVEQISIYEAKQQLLQLILESLPPKSKAYDYPEDMRGFNDCLSWTERNIQKLFKS